MRMSESLASLQAGYPFSRATSSPTPQDDDHPVIESAAESAAAVRSTPRCALCILLTLIPPSTAQARLQAMHAMLLGGSPGGGDGSELLVGGRGGDMAEMMASLEARSRARLEHHAAALRASRPPVTYGGLDPAAYDAAEWAWAEAMGELPTVRAWVPAAAGPVAPRPLAVPAEAPDSGAPSLSAGDVDGLRSYLAALPPSSAAAASRDSEAAMIRAMIAEAEASMSGSGGGGGSGREVPPSTAALFDLDALTSAFVDDDSKGDDGGGERGSGGGSGGLPPWARSLHTPLPMPAPPSSHLLSLMRGESVSSVGMGPGEQLPPAPPPWLRRRDESVESGADGSDSLEAGQGPAGIPPSALAGSSATAALVPSCALTRGRVVWEVRSDRLSPPIIDIHPLPPPTHTNRCASTAASQSTSASASRRAAPSSLTTWARATAAAGRTRCVR